MAFSNLLFKGIRLYLITFAVLSLTAVALAKTGPTHNKLVVCYISSWSVYRPGRGAYSIENFDANLCTHAIYAFAGLDSTESAIKSLDPWQDLKDDFGKGGYERLTGLKQTYPHLKVSLAIGGWSEGSKNYSILAAEPLQRDKFVAQVTSFVRKYNFDGLDFNWEYPTQRDGQAKDRNNFVLLIKQLRQEFDKYNLLLTSTISAEKKIIDEAYDVRQLSTSLDFLHVMCYDYHEGEKYKVNFNAPLVTDANDVLSVQYTIDYLIKLGAIPSKLVLGLPFYGRSFNTLLEGKIGDDSDGVGFQGSFTRENGFLGYNEICSMLSDQKNHWTSSWDVTASEVIARSQRDDSNGFIQVVTFDSSRSIANKVLFAMRKSLAGVSVWGVDTDDFLGDCELANDTFSDYKILNGGNVMLPKRLNSNYPLLRTINEAITYALEEIEMELNQSNEQQVKQQMKQEVNQKEIADKTAGYNTHRTASGSAIETSKAERVEKEMARKICFLTIPKMCFSNE